MTSNHLIYWIIPLAALVYIGAVLNLVRRRQLLETHALLWILTFVVVAISPFFVPLLDRFANRIGITYPPTLYLLVAIFFLMANTLRNTTVLSKLSEQNRRLSQELALLRQETTRKNPRETRGE